MIRAAVLAFALLLPGLALAKEQWLCTATLATGFFYENDKWNINKFNTDSEKFIVTRERNERVKDTDKRTKPSDYWKVKLTYFGNKGEEPCGSESQIENIIFCSFIGDFRLDLDTMRFLKTYIAGYTNGGDNNDNTPHIEIGVCAPL